MRPGLDLPKGLEVAGDPNVDVAPNAFVPPNPLVRFCPNPAERSTLAYTTTATALTLFFSLFSSPSFPPNMHTCHTTTTTTTATPNHTNHIPQSPALPLLPALLPKVFPEPNIVFPFVFLSSLLVLLCSLRALRVRKATLKPSPAQPSPA